MLDIKLLREDRSKYIQKYSTSMINVAEQVAARTDLSVVFVKGGPGTHSIYNEFDELLFGKNHKKTKCNINKKTRKSGKHVDNCKPQNETFDHNKNYHQQNYHQPESSTLSESDKNKLKLIKLKLHNNVFRSKRPVTTGSNLFNSKMNIIKSLSHSEISKMTIQECSLTFCLVTVSEPYYIVRNIWHDFII